MSKPEMISALLTLPRMRVEGANCISSPMTWGFPAITSFAGYMTALERKLGVDAGIRFKRFAVVCHAFTPAVTEGRYKTTFNLKRAPIAADGSTAAIVEEGRASMEVTLIFDIEYNAAQHLETTTLLANVVTTAMGMRLSGGSIFPAPSRWASRLTGAIVHRDAKNWDSEWRKLRNDLLPGYVLVLRHDILQTKLKALQAESADATALDAWMDICRINQRAVYVDDAKARERKVEWKRDEREGWLVPIPIGYAAISPVQDAGTVRNARDTTVPTQFVECIYSIGEWRSPHRFKSPEAMLWRTLPPSADGVYRCDNAAKAYTKSNSLLRN
jgi:CRISPR-associated protein Csy2